MADAKPTAPREGEWLAEESEQARKESQARARLASDVTVAVERTLKSFRQFGVRHKTSTGFVVDGTRRIKAFVDAHGELPLSIVGSDVLYDGESIYADPELRTSYPFLLFRDGVQRVILEPELADEELRTFCTLLRDQSLLGNQVQLEDDLVTLLWDADLQHVRYVVTESFKQDEVDAERERERQRLIERIKADAFSATMDAELSARFVRDRPGSENAQEDLSVAQAWERGNRIVADEKARRALVETVDTDDVLLRKFLEIVFLEILAHPKDQKTRTSLTLLVRDFAVEATRRDRLPEAIGVLQALGDLARHAGREGLEVAQEILSSIATPELLRELMHLLELADDQGTEQLLTFLALMPARESKRLVPLLPSVTTVARRRALCQLLAARLGDDLASIGEQVRATPEELALDLVFLLSESKSPRARVELLVALDHASSLVRRAAYDAIRKACAPTEATMIGASLLVIDDPDPELRRHALVSLPRQADVEVARRLRVVIGRDAFDDWDYSDKRRAYLAYAAASGKRAAKELLEVLTMRGVFTGEALEDRRCAAAFALASLGDDAHLAALEAETTRMFGAKRLKEACEAAMSMLKFKRPVEQETAALAPLVDASLVTQSAVDIEKLPPPIWGDR